MTCDGIAIPHGNLYCCERICGVFARSVRRAFQKSAASAQATENLSEREQQVLDLLSRGLIYKEIADKLGISYETVHTYIRRIYEKLQVRTRTEAVTKFLRR